MKDLDWIGVWHLLPAKASSEVAAERLLVAGNQFLEHQQTDGRDPLGDCGQRWQGVPGRQLALRLECDSVRLTRDVLLQAQELNITS